MEPQQHNNDHDLLIEVKTILRSVVDDFRSYRAESHKLITLLEARYAELERTKVSIVDFARHLETDNLRLNRLERAQWVLIGAMIVIQFIAPYVIKSLTEHL